MSMYLYVYVCVKFEVSSIILTSFRQEGVIPPLPPQKKFLKNSSRLVLKE